MINEIIKRYTVFAVSLFIMSLGVALTLRANLGSSPISVVPFVWSMAQGINVDIPGYTFKVPTLTLGEYTICMNMLIVLAQLLLLRKKFPKVQLLQMVVVFLFGFFLDFAMYLTSWFQWGNMGYDYVIRFIQMLAGGCILAFGIACEVRCNVLVLPGEGLAIALTKVTHIDFAKAKIMIDSALVIIGICFTYLFFKSWQWNMVGIGTIISMIFVGVIVRVISPKIGWLDLFLFKQKMMPEMEQETVTELPLVITIAREFGSGGHEIGKKLAKKLDIGFYDKEIIDYTAKELGLKSDFVEKNEQNISNTKLFELIIADKQIPEGMNLSEDNAIFVTQSRIIRHMASRKSCVIIGRCANYILKGRSNCFNIFIISDAEFARKRVMEEFSLNSGEAENKIRYVNKARANHYWQHTGERWNDANHYDLVINSSRLGIDGAVDVIKEVISKAQEKHPA